MDKSLKETIQIYQKNIKLISDSRNNIPTDLIKTINNQRDNIQEFIKTRFISLKLPIKNFNFIIIEPPYMLADQLIEFEIFDIILSEKLEIKKILENIPQAKIVPWGGKQLLIFDYLNLLLDPENIN